MLGALEGHSFDLVEARHAALKRRLAHSQAAPTSTYKYDQEFSPPEMPISSNSKTHMSVVSVGTRSLVFNGTEEDCSLGYC